MNRRAFLGSALAAGATTFELPPRFQAQIVPIRGGWAPGDIHVDPNVHHLYLILPGAQAIRYGVAIGRGDAMLERVALLVASNCLALRPKSIEIKSLSKIS